MTHKKSLTLFLVASLVGCGTPGYQPQNASQSVQDQMRNANPASLNCPVGSVATCDVEGGGLVGKTYANCRCAR